MRTSHKVCNIEYDNDLNKRINARYFPSAPLQPNFSPIPSSTRYQRFQVNNESYNNDNLNKYPEFEGSRTFYPGTSKGPVQTALNNVDVESKLRNQFFALQRNDQAVYIPDVSSSLYNSHYNTKPSKLDHCAKIENMPFNPDRCGLAPLAFNNSTRYNLKNI